ncbi:hypothetical protein LH51_14745 [Nitrincola sp. A-D6]|nr:hypothetical protein LH51_14745 [Nitrincola sp. A-D6]
MVVSLWCDALFVIHDRSAAALTAMDGGNAENAGAFFGLGARRSPQSDTTTPPTALCQIISHTDLEKTAGATYIPNSEIVLFKLSAGTQACEG